MKKRRNLNSVKAQPGEKYWNLLIDDEAKKINKEEESSGVSSI